MAEITIFEHADFQGRSMALGIGQHRLFGPDDMNDLTSSIKVPAGLVAYVYEHADSVGGFGISADFLEDCADLSQFDFNDKVSYVDVFEVEKPDNFIWSRGRVENGQFIHGHWERKRANGQLPPNNGVAVAPPIAGHDLVQPTVTSGGTLAVPDSGSVKNHVIPSFNKFDAQAEWDQTVNREMGIVGTASMASKRLALLPSKGHPTIQSFPISLTFGTRKNSPMITGRWSTSNVPSAGSWRVPISPISTGPMKTTI